MIKSILGIAPQLEDDGSYRPSKLALRLATSDVTDFTPVPYERYRGQRSKVLVIFTEQKNMTMQNGLVFSTGNHPVEALVPLLHLRDAGFEFEIATPTGQPVIFELWAMPQKDEAVMSLYTDMTYRFKQPRSLQSVLETLDAEENSYAAVFVPGGHGAMLGIPQDPNVGKILRWAHDNERPTITLCHGPGALLSTTVDGGDFLYDGYEMAVFPDAMDKKTPMIGYLPGPMPWELCDQLQQLGARIVNRKADDTCCVDRNLITGASPAASNKLGQLAAETLLNTLQS